MGTRQNAPSIDEAFALVVEAGTAKAIESELGCKHRQARRYVHEGRIAGPYRLRAAAMLERLAVAILRGIENDSTAVLAKDHAAMVARATTRRAATTSRMDEARDRVASPRKSAAVNS